MTAAITPAPWRPAFTLVELLVAIVILTVVTGATTIAVYQALRSRDAASAAVDAFSRAQLAAGRMATDAGQALRDAQLKYAKISITGAGTSGGSGRGGNQGLLLFTHQNRPARSATDTPEGEEYEVEYRLEPGPPPARGVTGAGGYTLWRRSDPVPDETFDGGGVAAPIADGVVSLAIDAYDGAAWRSTWDSDQDGYPHAIRIQVSATDDNGRHTSTVRRVVAFDRTPPPKDDSDSSGTGSTTNPGTGSTPSTGSGAGTTGGSGSGGTGTGGTGRTGTGGAGGTGTTGGGRTGGGSR